MKRKHWRILSWVCFGITLICLIYVNLAAQSRQHAAELQTLELDNCRQLVEVYEAHIEEQLGNELFEREESNP